MNVSIEPSAMQGAVQMIPSKSHLHRLLICACLADRESLLLCQDWSAEDVQATIGCLVALGASMQETQKGLLIEPIRADKLPEICVLPCKESGSTLRFLLPIVTALGVTAEFHMEGRLPQRPMEALESELSRMGAVITRPKEHILRCEGKLRAGHYRIAGNISSQYITGLLFALPLLDGDSSLEIIEPIESKPYIDMTLQAQSAFGISHIKKGDTYAVAGGACYRTKGLVEVEGDWSNAAFWLCAGAMPNGDMTVHGLKRDSLQGDKAVLNILGKTGARVTWEGDCVRVREGSRMATEIDATEIPDLVPVLAVVSAISHGTTRIINAGRLRIKESDRLESVTQTLTALGATISQTENGLCITGVEKLQGGTVDAWGDHRIAMMAAVASSACREIVTIKHAQAVNKSYPSFWDAVASLGVSLRKDVD